MKYWRGYLVAAVFGAISLALVAFAKAHTELVDMIYPYMTRMIVSSLADWSSGVSFCVWHVVLLTLVVAVLVSMILMMVLRWNFVQWLGWVLAVFLGLNFCSTLLYGLNDYTGPLADDIRLEVTEYTISEMTEAATYFRDQANELAQTVERDAKGKVKFSSFKKLARDAADGFDVLAYDNAISIFSGSTAPVKEMPGLSTGLSATMPLTGESVVDPNAPAVALPFIMCMEMARRMSISNTEDAKLAAFLACKANPSAEFQYSAYCVAYYYCYDALSSIPTSTAQDSAAQVQQGVGELLKTDYEICRKNLGRITTYEDKTTDAADLLVSWYIQEFITPLHQEEEIPFNPTDTSQVDLTYTAPTPTPLPKKTDE